MLYEDTVLAINAFKNNQTIYIGATSGNVSISTKQYTLSLATPSSSNASYDDNNAGNQYETDSSRQGQLTVTKLDKVNKRVEGVFYFKAFNIIFNDSINVTEGKFSITYTNH